MNIFALIVLTVFGALFRRATQRRGAEGRAYALANHVHGQRRVPPRHPVNGYDHDQTGESL